MNILITGGTGFVGKPLTTSLTEKGHHVYILTRSPANHEDTKNITYINYQYPVGKLPIIHAVINLAGDSLFGLWTKDKKERILTSRIETTNKLVKLMKQMKVKPDVFISGSAIGYYGTSESLIFTEETTRSGNDFLSSVATKWEEAAKQAEDLGIRTVYTRFGVVLGKDGSLPLMSLPIKMFAGGKIGNGEHWTSWVHVDDVVGLILFSLFNEEIKGPINVTSPNPKRNKEFNKKLARVLKRPYWFTTPKLMIKLAIGELSELIIKGQYVLPKKAEHYNYSFLYPNLEDALKEIHSE